MDRITVNWIRLLPIIFLGIQGCGDMNTASTEVGNPEVLASIRIHAESTDTTGVPNSMTLRVMNVHYRDDGEAEETLWEYPDGRQVDIAKAGDSSSLPPRLIQSSNWVGADMLLYSPEGSLALPDSLSDPIPDNPRYVRTVKSLNGIPTRFQIEFPADLKFRLFFDSSTVQPWCSASRVALDVVFDWNRWMAGIGDGFLRTRYDSLGSPYVIINEAENQDAYLRLKALLPVCFKADSVAVF
jgi:hypothetical protein